MLSMDKQSQGMLLVLAGIILLGMSFQATGPAQLFDVVAGVALLVWGILWLK